MIELRDLESQNIYLKIRTSKERKEEELIKKRGVKLSSGKIRDIKIKNKYLQNKDKIDFSNGSFHDKGGE